MRTKLVALMIIPLLLTAGCGGAQGTAMKIRTKMQDFNAVTMTAEVTADYGLAVYPFTLRYEGVGGEGTVTVLAPDSVAGIKAHLTEGSLKLEYEDLILDTGPVFGQLGPVNALSLLLEQWENGYVTAISEEGEQIAVTTDCGNEITQTTWFDRQELVPVYSEINCGGQRTITASVTEMTMKS